MSINFRYIQVLLPIWKINSYASCFCYKRHDVARSHCNTLQHTAITNMQVLLPIWKMDTYDLCFRYIWHETMRVYLDRFTNLGKVQMFRANVSELLATSIGSQVCFFKFKMNFFHSQIRARCKYSVPTSTSSC